MQITWRGKNSLEIKTKGAVIVTGDQTKVNDFILPGSGEYEIAGVEVFGIGNNIYLFRAEDIGIAYLGGLNRGLTNEETEVLSDTSIVIVPVGGNNTLDSKGALGVVKTLEPTVIIPIETEDIGPFCQLAGGCQDPIDTFKLTKVQLAAMEGQTIVTLIPK